MVELNASEVFDRAREVAGARTDAELAGFFGKSPNHLAVWRQRGTIPTEHLVGFCEARGVSIRWLLTGRGPVMNEPQVDLARFLEVCMALNLARADWEQGKPEARATMQLTFGRSGGSFPKDIEPFVLAQQLEAAFEASMPAVSAVALYNDLPKGEQPGPDGHGEPAIFDRAYSAEMGTSGAPLSMDARRYLRSRLVRLIEFARERLGERRALESIAPAAIDAAGPTARRPRAKKQ